MPLISKFFGNTVGQGAAFAIGAATAPTLRPALQELENQAWARATTRPLDAETVAAIVAEDVAKYQWGENEAGNTGISPGRFRDLYGEALNAPGLGPLLELWRRGLISDGDFAHGLRKAKLEGRWDGPLEGLRDTLLDSAELAMLQQQGFISPERANTEGRLQGVTNERQQLRFEASGLPPGIETALQMLRRRIIGDAEFAQIVREGHTKTKYTDELLALERRLLSVTEYVDAHLRGYITEAEMYEGTALWGLTRADTDTLFNSHGRPITVHQVTTGLARGGVYDGPTGDIPAAFINSLRQGSIKPVWYDLAYANRYTLPSPFVMRALTSDGTWSAAKAESRLLMAGWIPEDAREAAQKWATPSGTVADPHIKKAQTSLYNTTRSAYLAGDATDAVARAKLPRAGVSAGAVDDVLALWKDEREVDRARLTPAQLKKAFAKVVKNPLTGQPWTRDEVLAELLARGWNSQDANTFLDTPSGP